jgi:hypothetical protein
MKKLNSLVGVIVAVLLMVALVYAIPSSPPDGPALLGAPGSGDVTGPASPNAGSLTKWGVGKALVDGVLLGTMTDGKWCTYTTLAGFNCTSDAPLSVHTTITVADNATDTTEYVALFGAATGNLGPRTSGKLKFDSVTGALTSDLFYPAKVASTPQDFTVCGGDNSTGMPCKGFTYRGPPDPTVRATSFIWQHPTADPTAGQVEAAGTVASHTTLATWITPLTTASAIPNLADGNMTIAAFSWDGGGAAIGASLGKRCAGVAFAGTINKIILTMSAASTTVIKPYKDAFSDTTLPTTEISGGNFITTTAKLGKLDRTLTGWTGTAVLKDEVICADMTTNDVAQWATLKIIGHQ